MRRTVGGPKKTQLGFRATEALRAFVDDRSIIGNIGISDVVREATELYRDIFENLGPNWFELVRRAGISQKSVGQVIASLVAGALAAEAPKAAKAPASKAG